MAYELLNAILDAQRAIRPSNPIGDMLNGQEAGVKSLDLDEKARILNSREQTQNMLASGDYQGALANAQNAGDIDNVKLALARQGQNRDLIGSVAQRLRGLSPERRQQALASIAPSLQAQGIDPSSIDLSDDSLTLDANMPISSKDQIEQDIDSYGSQARMLGAQAQMERARQQGIYNDGRLRIDQQNADTNAGRLASQNRGLDIQQQNADTSRYNSTHKTLAPGSVVIDSSDDFNGNNGTHYDGQTNPANAVYGHGAYGVPSKPISSMTLDEANQYQDALRAKTAGQIGQGQGIGTSAIGIGGFTRPTLNQNMSELYGNDAPNMKLTPEVQLSVLDHQLDKNLASSNKARSLKGTFASLQGIPDAILNNADKRTLMGMITSGENGVPLDRIQAGTIPRSERSQPQNTPANVPTPIPSVQGDTPDAAVDPENANSVDVPPSPTTRPVAQPSDGVIPSDQRSLPQNTPANVPTPTPTINGTTPQARPTTYRGNPILYSPEDKEDYASRGGGLAYLPNGSGGYNMTNVKESKPSDSQQKNASYMTRFGQSMNEVNGIFKQGFDPRSAENYLAHAANFVNSPELAKAQIYNNALENMRNIMLRFDSGAALSDTEIAEAKRLTTINPTDSPETVVQKMNVLNNFYNTLHNSADGKVDTRAILKNAQNSYDEVNNIKNAIRNKDMKAIGEYSNKYSRPVVAQLAKQIQNEPIPDDDAKSIIAARQNRDVNTMKSMINKYGAEKVGKLFRQ